MSNTFENRRSHDSSKETHQLLVEELKPYTDFEIDEERNHQSSNAIQYRSLDAKTIGMVIVALLRNISIRNILYFLKPSFLQGPEARAKIWPAKLHPTAYLDGMRGVAAFAVFIFHLLYSPYMTQRGWGAGGKHWSLWRLPVIRLLYQGPINVNLFFVISGYALSYRTLKLLRAGKMLDGYQALTSTVLRRWARLFLPTAASTWIILLLVRIGAYDTVVPDLQNRKYWRNFAEYHPPKMDTFFGQVWHWMGEQYLICNLNQQGGSGLHYDGHLWTIPIEFRNSLYLFLTIIGTSRLQTKYRITLVCIVILNCWSFARYNFVQFLGGMLIAEWDLIRGAHNSPSLPTKESSTQKRSMRNIASWIAVNFVAIYLMSTPDSDCEVTPGYSTLCGMVPKYWSSKHALKAQWWQTIAAILFVLSVSRVSFWMRFYESGIVQYLGKISYSVYLVHGMVLKVLGQPLELWIWRHITGVEGMNRFAGWFLGACVTVPVCIWWADVFWRMVDIPVVAFGKWAEGKIIKRD